MKYPCDLIRDLLPLYQDGVCSEESRAAVEEHLRECPSCRAYQTALCEADGLFPVSGEEPEQTADQELRKAASLRAVRKTLLQGRCWLRCWHWRCWLFWCFPPSDSSGAPSR